MKELDNANLPLIYAGYGCTLHRELFHAFIDKLNIPVMLSWRAIDLLIDGHPLDAGRPGMFAPPSLYDCLDDADLILVLGARIDDSITNFDINSFAPNAKKIVVDIDQAELDRLPDDYIKICQEVGEFMKEVIDD